MINFSKAFRQVQICLNAQAKSTKIAIEKFKITKGLAPGIFLRVLTGVL